MVEVTCSTASAYFTNFDVTALDLSPYATKVASEVAPPAEFWPGSSVGDLVV